MKKTIVLELLALGICSSAYCFEFEPTGGANASPDPVEIHVRYRRGHASIDTLYLDNKASLDSLVSILGRLSSEPQSGVTISLKGSASPDGTAVANKRLAEKRAASLRDYILANTGMPASAVTVEESDIDWRLLKDMISATDQPWRDEAVSIISEVPIFIYDGDNRIVDGRKNRLGMLYGGRAWRYMEDHFFGGLRTAGVSLEFPAEEAEDAGQPEKAVTEAGETVTEPAEAEAVTEAADNREEAGDEGFSVDTDISRTVPAPVPVSQSAGSGPMMFVLKTNLLHDIVAVPDIGVEIPVGEYWSVGAEWMYAWWKNDSRHRYWRVYGGEIEARRWFPMRRNAGSLLSGHHVGLYGQMLAYDFEWGGKGRLGDRWSWGAGLSYGYSLPIADRLNIDFSVGVGYLQGRYMEYHPEDGCYVWDSTHVGKWFGPTKAGISLVWFIGGRDLKRGGGR